MSAYRIVQEALTNVLKHAGPARADVLVRYLPDALELEVSDDGPGAATARHRRRPRPDRDARAGRRCSAARCGPAPVPGGGYQLRARAADRAGARVSGIRVVVADDQPLMRAGFRMILEAQPDIEVVGEAADGAEAVAPSPSARSPTWC